MVNVAYVVIVYSPCVFEKFAEVFDVLFHDTCHVLELCHFMTVMLTEHAFHADELVAHFTEVFDLLLRVFRTVNCSILTHACFL